MENADKSLDHHPEHGYIPIHRYYLSTEIRKSTSLLTNSTPSADRATNTVFIIITLHRPWLLRRLKSDKFALSRRACYDAAKMDFRIVSLCIRALTYLLACSNFARQRQAFRAEHPGVHNAYVGGQFREFVSVFVCINAPICLRLVSHRMQP